MTRRRVLAVLAAACLAAPAAASAAFDPGVDPSTFPRLDCQAPAEVADRWCGVWDTEPPGGSAGVTFAPKLFLTRVEPAAARAAVGRPFGNFAFDPQPACSDTAIWLRGTYTRTGGVSGQVLACANVAGRLVGQYRDDPQPGQPFLSGSFGLDHVLANPPGFRGEIVEHFRGSAPWGGTCSVGACLTPPAPGGPGTTPPPAASPERITPDLQDLLNGVDPGLPCATALETGVAKPSLQTPAKPAFCGFTPLRDDVRAGVEGNAATFAGGALVACLSALAGSALVAVSAPATAGATAPALPPAVQWLGITCAAALAGWWGAEARTEWDDIVRRRTGTPTFERALGPRPHASGAATRRILLPRARLRLGPRAACPRGPSGARCRRVDATGRRAASSAGVVASLSEALAATAALGRRAAAAGDVEGAAIQSALTEIYTGALAAAVAAQSRAFADFATALRSAGLERRLTRGQARAAAGRISRLKGVPPVVVARLRADGATMAQIRSGFRRFAGVPARPLTLTATLGAAAPVPGLAAAPDAVTVAQVAAIVRGLRDQGHLPATTAAALLTDLVAVQRTTGAARAAAESRLRTGARRAPGRYGLVLRLGVQAVA